MNKTVTINLAGLVFHIDDNAYDVLRAYLEKLNAHFAGPSGKEVLNDIEARIAEMFQAKLTNNKNVIVIEDVNEVIAVMGKPEDIAGESVGEPNATAAHETTYKTGRKRVYRNPDDKVLGGVCSGIAAYFDIDPVWLRVAFVVAVIFGGTGILLYIILWIIIPEAKTASEKLEMRGEAVNISNIQRNVQAELESVQNKLGEWQGKLNSDGTRRMMNRSGNFLRDMLVYAGRFVITVVGIFLSAFAIALLIGLTVMLFIFLGVIPAEGIPADHLDYFVDPGAFWILMIGGLLVFGVPVLVLLLNGIKIIFRLDLKLRRTGAVMLGLWLIGIGLCIWQGALIGRQYKSQSYTSRTELVQTGSAKTLRLKANDIIGTDGIRMHGKGWDVRVNDQPLLFTPSNDTVWCANVRLDIDKSRNDSVYVTVTQRSRGGDPSEARVISRRIEYAYAVQDSVLLFDNAFNLNYDKYRVQGVDVTLKIPVDYTVVLDRSLRDVIYDVDNVTNVVDEDMIGHAWRMTEDGLECLDCAFDEKKKEIIVPEDEDINNRHEIHHRL